MIFVCFAELIEELARATDLNDMSVEDVIARNMF